MDKQPGGDRLELSREERRQLGYSIVDLLVDNLEGLGEQPVGQASGRAELERLLGEKLPEQPTPIDSVLEQVRDVVLRNVVRVDHPRFFAYVPGPGNFVSVMADALAAGFNVFAGAWGVSSGPAQIELVVLDWLRTICGMPETAGGILLSGGSMANLTAIAVARQISLGGSSKGGIVYCSDQTHSSVERALMVLGFEHSQLRTIETGGRFRLDPADLLSAITADRAAGLIPFCLIANAGTTSTGDVDPIDELAEVCREQGIWLHVDGAYGAAAALCDKGRSLLSGIGKADSIALDPHKWLFQPFEIGCLLVRESGWLRDTFHILPDYLRDTDRSAEDPEVNFRDRGIQLTRSFRALKLWMSIKVFGVASFRNAIEHGIAMAEHAEQVLRRHDCWQVITPAQLAIVTFRYLLPGGTTEAEDDLNRRLAALLAADGFALLSTTMLHGRAVLRLCTINPRTSSRDIEGTIARLEGLAGE